MKRKPPFRHVREVEAFLEMLQAERGASKNTLLAYAADLADLQSFLARRKQSTVTADATALRAYLKSLDYVGMTPRTVARRLSVILAVTFRIPMPSSRAQIRLCCWPRPPRA